MKGLRLIATGGALPGRTVTNEELSRTVDTSDEWITTRTGIRTRHYCTEGENAATLAIAAAKQALQRSGLAPADIACCVCATLSAPDATPSVACQVQAALALPENRPALDVNAACSGFLYGTAVARGLLATLGGRYALVIGTEALSRLMDPAACSNAGALGIIGAGGMNADTLRENIRRCKQLTDKPFGVNIMLMHPQADEFAQIVVEEGVQVVTTGAGNPGKYVPMWKAAGIKVIPVVAAAVLAKHLEKLGIDAVIAEGTESGGHVGEMATMALVPQVVDAVDLPVIAAGGIADGRQLAAALALGACGVQVGTCLLVSEECPIHENYKAALLNAKDSDTIVTGRIGGSPVRVLKNRMSREYVRQEKAGADKMELEKYTLGSLRRAVFEGDTSTGSLMAGQVAGMLHEVRPVADILDDLWNGGRQRIHALSEEC